MTILHHGLPHMHRLVRRGGAIAGRGAIVRPWHDITLGDGWEQVGARDYHYEPGAAANAELELGGIIEGASYTVAFDVELLTENVPTAQIKVRIAAAGDALVVVAADEGSHQTVTAVAGAVGASVLFIAATNATITAYTMRNLSIIRSG